MAFRFTYPYFFILSLAVLPVVVWYLRSLRTQEPTVRFSSLAVAARLAPSARQRLRSALDVFRVFALLLLVIALARPNISRAEAENPGEGIDIVLAVDVSYSMSEHDLGPKSRLQTAKEVIRNFMLARQTDRVGLVVFAGEAVTQSPLSLDYTVLLQLLDSVDHGRLPEGTAIGNGLATSVNLLRESRSKSRIVILLTDGQSNSGDIEPNAASNMAELLKVKVYTIGVGATPGSQSERGARSASTALGSGIDEELLRRISEHTDAAYFRATDQKSLAAIYDMIDSLETTKQGKERFVEVHDLTSYFLGVAGLLLFLEIALRNTWFRKIP